MDQGALKTGVVRLALFASEQTLLTSRVRVKVKTEEEGELDFLQDTVPGDFSRVTAPKAAAKGGAIGKLTTLGIRLSGLLAAAGLMTVALGFAAQTSVSNIISGFFLLMEKPFEVGDVVDIVGNVGVVLSLDLLSTKLRTSDNLFVRIPNENILKKPVKTFSKYQVRRIGVKLSIAYKEKIAEAKEIVRDFLKSSPLVLEDPRPLIITRTLGDSGVEFVAKVWIDRTKFLEARDAVTAGIKKALDDAGIEIPFPHLTMYMGDPSRLRMQGRGRSPLAARSPRTRSLMMGIPRPPKRPRHQ